VTAMNLDENDEIVDMFNYYKNMYLAIFSQEGNAKAILTEEIKVRRK